MAQINCKKLSKNLNIDTYQVIAEDYANSKGWSKKGHLYPEASTPQARWFKEKFETLHNAFSENPKSKFLINRILNLEDCLNAYLIK